MLNGTGGWVLMNFTAQQRRSFETVRLTLRESESRIRARVSHTRACNCMLNMHEHLYVRTTYTAWVYCMQAVLKCILDICHMSWEFRCSKLTAQMKSLQAWVRDCHTQSLNSVLNVSANSQMRLWSSTRLIGAFIPRSSIAAWNYLDLSGYKFE